MKDTHKEEGTEDQAEKRCSEWVINIALLSNGFILVSQFCIFSVRRLPNNRNVFQKII